MQISDELKKKAMTAKNAEELLGMAEENHIEMTLEQASNYYSSMHTEGKISDDELDNVAGGCGSNEETYVCPICGSTHWTRWMNAYFCSDCLKVFDVPKKIC